jgi:sulfoxide reductase heme-binding subunit YedZ
MRIDPARYIWWLTSRASGVVALGLVALSVLLGLTMATKIVSRPGLGRRLAGLHEHAALMALATMAVHGATLLGDRWLHAGVRGLVVPFTMGYRPLWTGLGMIGGYLAALLGLSFYVRRRIGTKLWRRVHRATVLVYVLAVIHTLGAGSDVGAIWLRMFMIATGAPIVFLTLVRYLERRPRTVSARATPAGGAAPAMRTSADASGAPPRPDAHTLRAHPRPAHDGAVREDGALAGAPAT